MIKKLANGWEIGPLRARPMTRRQRIRLHVMQAIACAVAFVALHWLNEPAAAAPKPVVHNVTVVTVTKHVTVTQHVTVHTVTLP